MKIIKEKLQFEESLKQRLEFICEFAKVKPIFLNGSIRKIEKTNLSYIEPHRVIIKNTTFLIFNYSNVFNISKTPLLLSILSIIAIYLIFSLTKSSSRSCPTTSLFLPSLE